eukprot:3307661-Amphidinium_carterae.2
MPTPPKTPGLKKKSWRMSTGQIFEGDTHQEIFHNMMADDDISKLLMTSVCFPSAPLGLEAAAELSKLNVAFLLRSFDHEDVASDAAAGFEARLKLAKEVAKLGPIVPEHEVLDFGADVASGTMQDVLAPVDGGPAAAETLLSAPADDLRRQLLQHIVNKVHKHAKKKMDSDAEACLLMLHGPGGCGKSFLAKAVTHVLRRSDIGVMVAAPTGCAAHNIGGMTLHAACALPVFESGVGRKSDAGPPGGQKLESMRELWTKVGLLIIDEVSMVSEEMLHDIDAHLRAYRVREKTKPFGGLSLIMMGDFYQLPPVNGRPVFKSPFLWRLFSLVELTGNVRAASDPEFAALLARLRIGEHTPADVELLQRREPAEEEDKQVGKAVCLFPRRDQVARMNSNKMSKVVPPEAAFPCVAADTYDQPRVGSEVPLSDRPEDPRKTAGLEQELEMAVGARVMLLKNMNIQDGLCNGAIGTVAELEFARGTANEILRVHVCFDGAGRKFLEEHPNDLGAIPITRMTLRYAAKDGRTAYRTQFPLTLAWAMSIHKSQGQTCKQGAVVTASGFHPGSNNEGGLVYVAASRCPSLDKLWFAALDPKAIKVPSGVELGLTSLRLQQAKQSHSQTQEWKAIFQPEKTVEDYIADEIRLLAEATAEDDAAAVCQFCGEVLLRKEQMSRHLKQCLKKAEVDKAISKCPACPKQCKTPGGLKLHIKQCSARFDGKTSVDETPRVKKRGDLDAFPSTRLREKTSPASILASLRRRAADEALVALMTQTKQTVARVPSTRLNKKTSLANVAMTPETNKRGAGDVLPSTRLRKKTSPASIQASLRKRRAADETLESQTSPKHSKPPLPPAPFDDVDGGFDFAAYDPWAEGDECAVHNAAAGLPTLTTAPPTDYFDEDDVFGFQELGMDDDAPHPPTLPAGAAFCGLINLGNSCFINATTQVLLASPEVQSVLSRVTDSSSLGLNVLAAVQKSMDSRKSFVPKTLTDIFYSGEQMDAQEFLVASLVHPARTCTLWNRRLSRRCCARCNTPAECQWQACWSRLRRSWQRNKSTSCTDTALA